MFRVENYPSNSVVIGTNGSYSIDVNGDALAYWMPPTEKDRSPFHDYADAREDLQDALTEMLMEVRDYIGITDDEVDSAVFDIMIYAGALISDAWGDLVNPWWDDPKN